MMSVLSLRLPKSMHDEVRALAKEEGISLNQFVTLALSEKIASIKTVNYLEERARRGSRDKLLAILAKAPDVEPEDYDRV